jgi:VanZ family protein
VPPVARERLLRLLFWAAAAFAFVMAVIPHPPDIPGHPSDKIQHAIAFATLGLLGACAYRRTRVARLLIGLSAFGAAIEIVQAIPALHRDSDALDWLVDTLACGAALVLMRWRRP